MSPEFKEKNHHKGEELSSYVKLHPLFLHLLSLMQKFCCSEVNKPHFPSLTPIFAFTFSIFELI